MRTGPEIGPAAATNGNGAAEPHGHVSVSAAGATDWIPDVRAELAALRIQMEELTRTVDRVTSDTAVSDDALHRMARANETLPERIGTSLTTALREHYDALLGELQVVNDRLSARIDVVAASTPSDEGELLREIDARFEWLVTSLSDRLVLIGNEVAGLQKQLSAAIPASNRPNQARTDAMSDSAATRERR